MANTDSFLESVDKAITERTEPIADAMAEIVFYNVHVFGYDFPWIVGWLVVAGLVFSAYFGFAQLRHLKIAFRLVRGKYEQKDAPGEVSHFQALTSAVSGTVGLGNIAGVAIAVTIGGPGAIFWMVLCGILGMATKFVECTLGVKYREVHPDGTVSGGPMHYLRKGMAERGWAGLGRVLAIGSAVSLLFFTLFGGNLFQVNQSLEQLQSVTGKDDSVFSSSGGAVFFGVLIAAVVALVLIGGIRSIGAVTSKLVPSMALMYVLACATVILFNVTAVPDAIGAIFEGAFAPEGVVGGLIGAIIQGFRRAAFSNEAGIGSAPIAHSAVKTKRPATEGLVAMIEPFLDTVFVCSMTALTIVIASPQEWLDARDKAATGAAPESGVALTSAAFETALPWFPYVLTVAVLLFALSTIITWAYYGMKAWTYLFGRSRVSELVYKVLFCVIVIAGALMTLGSLVTMADSFLFLAAVFNIIGLYFLAPVVKRELRKVLDYVRRRDAGETDEEIDASEAAGPDSGLAAPKAL